MRQQAIESRPKVSPSNAQQSCRKCMKKQPEYRSLKSNHEWNGPIPPIVQEVLQSPGKGLDRATRAFMEPRFRHDFSQVRVHADARAAKSAKAVNAQAYAMGRSVVFGEGKYAPHMMAGKELLAHELEHVIQQEASGPRLQRRSIIEAIGGLFRSDNIPEKELQDYLEFLDKGEIEDNTDSDNKARAIVKTWRLGGGKYDLTNQQRKALLIREMQSGFCGDDDENAILEILERSHNFELSHIFGAGGVSPKKLYSDFHGDELDLLVDFFKRRFEGGMEALRNGKVHPVGGAVPLGIDLKTGRNLSDKMEKQTVVDTEAKESQTDPSCRFRKYDEALQEGARLSARARFGTTTGSVKGPDIRDSYDKTYWREDLERRCIVAIVEPPNKTPWIAIKELVASVEKRKGKTKDGKNNWSFDCFESVILTRIYAHWCKMSREEFDKKFNNLEIGWMPRETMTRLWNMDEIINAEGPGHKPIVRPTTAGEEGLRQESGPPRRIEKSWSQLIKEAPLGTWITWSNFHIHTTCLNPKKDLTDDEKKEFEGMCNFEHENTLKVGDDKYSAHPLGIKDRATIEKRMAESVPRKYRKPADYNDVTYIKKYIFISKIIYPKEV